MAAGLGFMILALAVAWLFSLFPINDPNPLAGDGLRGQNPSPDTAIYSAFTAFIVHTAGMVLLFLEVLTG